MDGDPEAAKRPLLDVAVTHARDVRGADEGGADRLWLLHLDTQDAHDGPVGLSPEPAVVSAVCKETELPVRVMLRLNDEYTTTGGELARMVGLGEDYLSVGAAGLAYGFLDPHTEIDTDVCGYLAERLPAVPWTFHSAFDHALDTELAWRRVRELPELDAVMSAGSPRGLDAGSDDLVERAGRDADVARLVMAGHGLRAEHVPWLVRAGVRQFHLGSAARPGGSWTRAHVDAGLVRSFRMLLDDAVDRALGVPPA